MAFQLKANEPVAAGVTRNVRRQLEKALEFAGASRKQPAEVSNEEAVFEVRKCFKRVRAALRLVRKELGDDLYHQENFCFRDAARPLTKIRDAHVLVETADKLKPEAVSVIDSKAFGKIRAALVLNEQEVTRRVLQQNHAFAAVKDILIRALAGLSDWRLTGDGWAAAEPGLRRVYRTAHRALALAAENPTWENLHEWRKQTKYLWHELQLLEWMLPEKERALIAETHKVATILGEDHDLAVLRLTLAADPLAYGGHPLLKNLFTVIDRRRRELEHQAFALGRAIYQDSPKDFIGRMGAAANCGAV